MTSFFSRAMATCAVLLLLNGCAETPDWVNNSWLGHRNVAHPQDETQIPKGPLQTPQAAPVPHVQSAPLPPAMVAPNAVVAGNTSKMKVAILLPLSGQNAALGQAMLNAAQQAMFDVAAPNFELMPRDTGGSDEQLDMATRDALASGAQLLIGPLFAPHVPIVHLIAQNNAISMLTLSTDTSLAAPGLYVMGFAPGAQVDRVVDYALAHRLRRFAALVPTSAYGSLAAQEFRTAVERGGGTLVELSTYNPELHDGDASLHDVVHDLADHRATIDALFLPEGGDELVKITTQLAAAGVDPHVVRMLGTGLWDVPDIARQNPFVVSGWYAASDPSLRQNFITTYTSTFGQAPPRLATLAYDATALAAVLARRGAGFDQAALTNPNGFAGLDGIFRLSPMGTVERGLAILEVTTDGAHVIDPGPATFATGRR